MVFNWPILKILPQSIVNMWLKPWKVPMAVVLTLTQFALLTHVTVTEKMLVVSLHIFVKKNHFSHSKLVLLHSKCFSVESYATYINDVIVILRELTQFQTDWFSSQKIPSGVFTKPYLFSVTVICSG